MSDRSGAPRKTVAITGAGSGIGRATALAFAREGYRVAASDISQPRLDALATELGDKALHVKQVDVASRDEMATWAAEIHTKLRAGGADTPAVDVVVNNAGVAVGGTFLETSLDDWDWLLGINLKGVVHGCHYFVPNMVERGTGGHVINIASILGIFAAPNVTAYVASKFAVLGFSRSLRVELEPHRIGVTAICPGLIATSIFDDSRKVGHVVRRRDAISATFKKGASPDLVARKILDAVKTNPAVRTVGRDAAGIAALTRAAPNLTSKLGGLIAKRLG